MAAQRYETPGYTLLRDSNLYAEPRGFIHTGCYLLNRLITGSFAGGWPWGKVIELYGDPSTGKSLLAVQALAQCQQEGGQAFLDDVEYALDETFAVNVGLDVEELHIGSSTIIEECFTNIEQSAYSCAKAGISKAVFVVDSIAMLSSKHEQEKGYEVVDLTIPKLVKQAMKHMLKVMANTGYLLIVLNQTISNIGGYGPRKTTPTGGGLKFASSVRLELDYAGQMNGDPPPGVLGRFYIQKNRVWRPFSKGPFTIKFDKGILAYGGLCDFLAERDVVICAPKRKGFYLLPDVLQAKEGSQEMTAARLELSLASLAEAEKSPGAWLDLLAEGGLQAEGEQPVRAPVRTPV